VQVPVGVVEEADPWDLMRGDFYVAFDAWCLTPGLKENIGAD